MLLAQGFQILSQLFFSEVAHSKLSLQMLSVTSLIFVLGAPVLSSRLVLCLSFPCVIAFANGVVSCWPMSFSRPKANNSNPLKRKAIISIMPGMLRVKLVEESRRSWTRVLQNQNAASEMPIARQSKSERPTRVCGIGLSWS